MIIYKTTNKINGKIYIGKDSRNISTYLGSGKILKNAIKKYGKENFTKEVIEYCQTLDELNEREIYWIKETNCQNPSIGYNIANGGDGGDLLTTNPNLDDIKQKMSIIQSGENNGFFGKHHTEETKNILRGYFVGKKLSDETKLKMTHSHTGLKHSEETKLKISETLKGRTLSEETKLKISETLTGRTLSDEHKKNLKKSLNKRKFSEEHKKNLSNSLTDRTLSDEHKKNLSDSLKGKKLSEETKLKISLALKNKSNKLKYVSVSKYDLEGNFICTYDSILDAKNDTGANHISNCCRNKCKSSGGFIWKYN